MRRLSAIATMALLLACGAAAAQTMSSAPALGPVSPLGIPGAAGAAAPAGIGLGATGINPGGLSPAITPNCISGACPGAASTSGGGIPLGATELGNAGVSPLIGATPPASGVGGCTGSTMSAAASLSGC